MSTNNVSELLRIFSDLNMGNDIKPARIVQELEKLLKYVKYVLGMHVRKKYTDSHMAPVCFDKNEFFSSDEFDRYCKVQLSVGFRFFELTVRRLSEELSSCGDEEGLALLRCYSDCLMDYFFDLKRPIEFLQCKTDANYIFFDGSKSYSSFSTHLYRFSQALAHVGKDQEKMVSSYHKEKQIAAAFVLRQSLELKFERMVGVVFYDKNLRSPRLRHGFHYSFALENPSLFSFPKFDFALLNSVYDWCSTVVHRAYQPFMWQLGYAHELCDGIFDWGEMAGGAGHTWVGGVRVLDVDDMRQKFIKYFYKEEESKKSKSIWLVNFQSPEAADYSTS
ncbi:hypothetical protein RZO07_19625 [Pseudomonas protegens]|uniref:hypothetical protein n=1 Tax=Pseudomonas protegens TaxID=380021 RepID=UPI002936F21C|nr:hypothetical protein [Pseudomonas protegens]WOE77519.1 hypothetical protein RZO07_19625 [Pseudomonas protegens]